MIQRCLQEMKACFEDCYANAHKLDQAAARRFRRLGQGDGVRRSTVLLSTMAVLYLM